MQGFDPKFNTFPDYILGITHEIWEQRGVDSLNQYYADDIIVRSPASVVIGNQAVIKATYATLDEFPDRQLLGEDVIWSGTPEEGYLLIGSYPRQPIAVMVFLERQQEQS